MALKRIVNYGLKTYTYFMLSELNERSREIFRFIVDSYLSSGSPIGSRTISKNTTLNLSPASIRNTMADLEAAGLLFAPHTSAGRMPTPQGLRIYIDGLMQIGGLSKDEREAIEHSCKDADRSVKEVLEQTGTVLSGLSCCASLVIAPKVNDSVQQIQFVRLQPRKILVVLVMQSGLVENRIMSMAQDIPSTALTAASNYLNAKLAGHTITEARNAVRQEIKDKTTQLDSLTELLVEKGLTLPNTEGRDGHIIVRGQSRLLEDVKALEELERARTLLSYLEEQENILSLLNAVHDAEGVQIFIGAENKIFDQSGWSMIIAPYKNGTEQIVGAIGVIGPTRLDYDRIIPMVDFTSQAVGRIIGKIVDEP